MLPSVFTDPRTLSQRAPSDLVVERCSTSRGWRRLHLEIGHNHGCDVRSLRMKGHVVGMQITGQPISVETYQGGRWVSTTLPSHQLFIHPTGTPLNIRHDLWTRWAIAIVDHPLCAVRRNPGPLTDGWSSQAETLTHLFRALMDQLCNSSEQVPGAQVLEQSLIESFALALHQHQAGAPVVASTGGITPELVARLREWIVQRLDQRIGVPDMADRVGYSTAHFAREFRRTSGVTPHAFLQEIRLTAALELGCSGMPIVDVADRCGFSDQSHFSNAFKRRFGFSPAYLKRVSVQ